MNQIVLSQWVLPFYRDRIHILHTFLCDCSVKTELIYRNNCAKNSFNRITISTEVYRQFSTTTFAFEHSSGQWTRGSEDWVCAFAEC